jgi:4'-phosphopantetheinyl transferase EntD
MQDDRSPLWPDDLVGSISHSHGTCVSVVANKVRWQAVGVDVESDRDLPLELWDLIGLPSELERASALPKDEQARWMMRVFSAKEGYYKWISPQTPSMLEFHDVEIVMNSTLESTDFQLLPRHTDRNSVLLTKLSGRLVIEQGLVTSLIIH